MPCGCHANALRVLCKCHVDAVWVSCRCSAGVILMQCGCHVDAVRVLYGSHLDAVRVQCGCHVDAVRVPGGCHVNAERVSCSVAGACSPHGLLDVGDVALDGVLVKDRCRRLRQLTGPAEHLILQTRRTAGDETGDTVSTGQDGR